MEENKNEKYIVLRDRPDMMTPAYWNAVYQTSDLTKDIYGIVLKETFYPVSFRKLRAIFLKKDYKKVSDYISSRLIEDERYFSNIKRKVRFQEEKIEDFIRRAKKVNFEEMGLKGLIEYAEKIQELSLNYDSANVYAWLLGGEEYQKKIFKILEIKKSDFSFLVTPENKSYISQYEDDFLKKIMLIKRGKISKKKAAEELEEDFGWIPHGYDGPVYWDKEYFINLIDEKVKKFKKKDEEKIKETEKQKQEKKERKKNLIEKYSLGREQKRLIRQAQEIAFFPENRKKYTFQLFFYYSKVIKRLETIFGISYENLKYLFTEELEDLEKNADELASLSEKRKKEGFLIYVNNLGIKILDKVKERILEAEIQDQAQDEKIEGFVAFKGKKKKYKGKVNVVIVPKDGKDFKKGDFLVTAMTSPDFIHYIKKAGAIITNEGGITSHAAIIARELEKPCIIGTKIATQVLKDGDLVELDMEKGTVKILEKI